MAASEPPVVECDGLTHEYRGDGSVLRRGTGDAVRALSDVSLAIEPGEVVGIAGPSGSGKSTLLHLLAGLTVPTEGSVRVGDVTVSELGGRRRARVRLDRIGQVFQRFYLLPALTARENVAVPLLERGVPKGERRRRAASMLERVGLDDRAGHRPTQLSGGERQRVAVARALVTQPDLVVADEPTGELDTETGGVVLDHLTDAGDDRAVVLASHDERALSRADRVVRLSDGERVDDGASVDGECVGGGAAGGSATRTGARSEPSVDPSVTGVRPASDDASGRSDALDDRHAGDRVEGGSGRGDRANDLSRSAAGNDRSAAGTERSAAGTDRSAAGTDRSAAGTERSAAGTDPGGATERADPLGVDWARGDGQRASEPASSASDRSADESERPGSDGS